MNTLVAITPQDMAPAQQSLIEWIDARQTQIDTEFKETDIALQSAIRNKWGSKALTKALNRLQRRLTFYSKIRSAVEAGYVLMPALAMDVIAIRTKARQPRPAESSWNNRFEQTAAALPEGEGAYKNPKPLTDCDTTTNDKGKEVTTYYPVDWNDEMEMPLALCKPELLERTQVAMARKLFDEIGVVRDNHAFNRRGDPIIVGTIVDPTRRGRRFAFFLAWALPLDNL